MISIASDDPLPLVRAGRDFVYVHRALLVFSCAVCGPDISLAVNAVIGSCFGCKWLVDPPNGHVVHDSGADDSTDIHIALMRSPDPIQKTKRRYV